MRSRVVRALLAAGVIFAWVGLPAHANVLRPSDAERFYGIRKQLRDAVKDINQASQAVVGSHPTFDCLENIYEQASLVEASAAQVGDLLNLSVLMRNSADERLVLHALNEAASILAARLDIGRQTINGYMSTCSKVATANVEGQVLLSVFSAMSGDLSTIEAQVRNER